MNKSQKKISVTIGIPAYNEENNIITLINDIFTQGGNNWDLKEIIVIDDHSSDKTNLLVRKISSEKIRIISHEKRMGKSTGMKELFTLFKSDLLILFDADERLKSDMFITNFVEEFLTDSQLMLASGDKKPFTPQTFLQRGLYSTYLVFHMSKLKIKNGNNIFGCQGGCIAIRSKFAKQINMPNVISEDAFLYLECRKRGYKFKYIDGIAVYYKLAKNVQDYYRQLFRSTPQSVAVYLEDYFGNKVKEEFHRPYRFYFSTILAVFLKDPFPTIYVILLNVIAKPLIPLIAPKYRSYWQIAQSTK